MPIVRRLHFHEGVEIVEAGPEALTLASREGRITVPNPGDGLVEAVRRLRGRSATEDDVAAAVLDEGGLSEAARFYTLLRRWWALGLLRWTVADGEVRLATLEPVAPSLEGTWRPVEDEERYVLSRFACCRRDGASLVAESPLASARIVFHDPSGPALLAGLARPSQPGDVSREAAVPEDQTRALLGLLRSADLIAPVSEAGRAPEDEDTALRQWEFHDLLFHRESRGGRRDAPWGAAYSYRGDIEPLPAVKPPMAGESVALHRPDPAALASSDPPYAAIAEARRSERAYGERPVTAAQLGEFLYRAARVCELYAPVGEAAPYESSRRPYPGGGGCYELEIYPIVNRCEGLTAGLYHYDPLDHLLRRLRGNDDAVAALVEEHAWVTTPARPQVVLAITARFARLSWKYRAIAYALMLKDVGALYQTMYLVATAMGLAPCAVGGGGAGRLAEAIGADYYAESAVGEFLLGSRRA